MIKITFIGAGSTVFAKNILGDTMLTESLRDAHIALYDIDAERLEESRMMVENLNQSVNDGRSTVSAHLGVETRREALKDADFVVNAIQVGGYRPSTVIDFEIPKKYGLRQTIADTLGIGGIFRGLRTIPVMVDFAHEMEEVCPDALLLNYTNPMAIVTGAVLRATDIATVGLCHSVQSCVPSLLKSLDMNEYIEGAQWKIAGINHMAWLLELTAGGTDIYPEVRKRAFAKNDKAVADGSTHWDMVRYEVMRHFGYYVTESSEHNAEYSPFWIKSGYPELIDRYGIPLDEYPRRCEKQIEQWAARKNDIVHNASLEHKRSHEYGSYIMDAVVTNVPTRIHGNVLNNGVITNLPDEAVVEVASLVDQNKVQPTYQGALPTQCAAMNMTNINVQLLTIEAALSGSRERLYQAAYLDPHTAAELPLAKIRQMCDELIDAHGDMLPKLA
ncbi:MAG: alpha-glucosidase/alpha-galactosidase [Spirochaetaceae bacterium]|nr:MAG: alpha-glucosidase/alpha-galactosidase [Spirochaetaceae bacterium]